MPFCIGRMIDNDLGCLTVVQLNLPEPSVRSYSDSCRTSSKQTLVEERFAPVGDRTGNALLCISFPIDNVDDDQVDLCSRTNLIANSGV